MAKLSGVFVNEDGAGVQRIIFGGIEYVRTEGPARAGDIVRCEDDDYADILRGEFFATIDEEDDYGVRPSIVDNADDKFSPFSMYPSDWTVFRRVDTAKAPEPVAADDTVTVDGTLYRKLARRPVVGDKLLALETRSDWTAGKLYECVSLDGDGDPRAIDDAGDLHYFRSLYQGVSFAVVEPVESAAAEVTDIVTHEGRRYRKVSREAVDGELAIVLSNANRPQHGFRIGQIVTAAYGIAKASYDKFFSGPNSNGGSGQYVNHADYAVLEPVETEPTAPEPTEPTQPFPSKLPDTYVIHDGAVYRKEARRAEVGEIIIVTGGVTEFYGFFKIGDIGRVSAVNEREDIKVALNHGKSAYVQPRLDQLYNVLVPTDSVTIGGMDYVLEKRLAAKGERILVVNKDDHRYDNGAIFPNVSDVRSRVYVKHPEGTRDGSAYVSKDEYVVLAEKKGTETAAEPTKPERLKVGDYARVVDEGTDMDMFRNFGDIVKIIEDDNTECPFNTEHIDGRYAGWANESDLVRATDEEVATAKDAAARAKFAAGDKVRLVSGGGDYPLNGYDNGAIYEVVTNDVEIAIKGGRVPAGYAKPDQLERVSAEEIAEIAKQAQQAAETAKWAAIGRKPGEYKAGDVVRVIKLCHVANTKVGDITAVKELRMGGVALEQLNSSGHNAWIYAEEIELIAPAESRFDHAAGE